MTRTASDWLEAVRGAERRGELLTAFDLAEQGLAEHPDDLWLKHRAVLALARAGRHGRGRAALRALRAAGGGRGRGHRGARARASPRTSRSTPPASRRRAQALRARDLYRAIHARTGGYYPAINAATLSLVAGEPQAARELARAALDAAARQRRGLLLRSSHGGGGPSPARRRARRAARRSNEPPTSTAATTRRWRRRAGSCAWCARSPGPIPRSSRILAGPGVAHFCGHRIAAPGVAGRFPAEAEEEVAAGIEAELTRDTPALRLRLAGQRRGHPLGRGSARARSGAARRPPLRARRVHRELGRLVRRRLGRALPSLPGRRLQRHLRDGERLRAPTTPSTATAAELAMGLALLRARYLDADVRQLAVWDGATGRRRGRDRARRRHLARRGTGRVRDRARHRRRRAGSARRRPRHPGGSCARCSSRTSRDSRSSPTSRCPRVLRARAGSVRRGPRTLRRRDRAPQHVGRRAVRRPRPTPSRPPNARSSCRAPMAAIDLAALGPGGPLALRIGVHVGPGVPARGAGAADASRSPGRTSAAPRGSSRSRRPARCT